MKAAKHPITLLALFLTMIAAVAIMTSAPTPTGAYDAPTGSTSNERLQQSDTPPAPPTGITLKGVTHDSVTISWTAPDHDDIRHFLVLRRNPAEQDAGVFIEVGTTSAGTVTTFTDSSLEPETRYVYRVKTVYDNDEISKRSSYINATTSEEPAPVPPPTPEPTSTPEPTPQPQQQQVNTADDSVLTESSEGDFPASTSTSAIISTSAGVLTVVGTIDEVGDIDWIKLENNGRQVINVYLTGYSDADHPNAGSPRFNPLIKQNGVGVHNSNPMKPPRGEQWTHYTNFPSGHIYLPVADQLGTGSYRITAVLDSEWEFSSHDTVDFPADATTSGFLDWHSIGNISPEDVDWFGMELSSGTRYRIHVESDPHGRLDRVTEVRLMDADGNAVPGASAVHEINVSPCQAGTNRFYVEVSDPNPVDDTKYAYSIWKDELGPTGNPTRGTVLGSTEAHVEWNCFAGADSHKLEYYRDGVWETVGTYNLPTKSANAVNLSETSNT